MDIGKCGYLGCISGWFGALRRALRVTVVDLGFQDRDQVDGNDTEVLDAILLRDSLILVT